MLMRHANISTTEGFYFDADIEPLRAGTAALDAKMSGADAEHRGTSGASQ